MVWLHQPLEWWRGFCYYTCFPHPPHPCFASLVIFLVLSSSPLFNQSVRTPPLQFDALPQLQIPGTKFPPGYHRFSSFSKKPNIGLSQPITMAPFLKSLWVCYLVFSSIFSFLHYIFDFDLLIQLVSDHVTVSFSRSGGPGGQNVNKGVCFIVIYQFSVW